MATTLGKDNPFRYRGYYYDNETGLYYLESRYYDPETGRFINADDAAFLGATGTLLSCNLFAYCEYNAVNASDPSGYLRIPSWAISVLIDAGIFALAGALHVTWLGIMAPLKLMGKHAAAAFFKRYLAKSVVKISSKIVSFGVKLLKAIGKAAHAAVYNISAKAAISAIIGQSMRFVTACMSVGGLIAAIWDYFSDKKFDGRITI